ncbi:MAG: YhjD/YihY/BrkB family envelope integrity protein [Myxococcota bacterium]|nr:YhjD/YihY/BrkB family envelope integrity protein [Myxococcota bacterium]
MQPHKKPSRTSSISRLVSELRETAALDEAEVDNTLTPQRFARLGRRNIRVLLNVARLDALKKLQLHAQALTYVTLLALVPLLAVLFAVFNALGGFDDVRGRIENFIFDHLSASAELREAIIEPLYGFVENIHAGQLGAISVAILIFSVLSLLGHIEFAVNSIFGTRVDRPIITRMLTYWAILTLGPILLAASFALTAAFQSSTFLQFIAQLGPVSRIALSITPLMVTWFALSVMYLAVPNTRVSPFAAIGAAMVSGTLWNIGKFAYAWYASHAFTLQNIYGSVAVIPLFILWLYISWLIVLFGAQLTFAFHNSDTYRFEEEGRADSHMTVERAALRILLEVCCDFRAGKEATTPKRVALQSGVPRRLLERCLKILVDGELVRYTDHRASLVPAREPSSISVHDVLTQIREGTGAQPALTRDPAQDQVDQALQQARQVYDEALRALPLSDLVQATLEARAAERTPRPIVDITDEAVNN